MSCEQIKFDFVEGDLLPELFFEFEGIDISGYASIELKLRKPEGTLITKSATVDDAPNGMFHFSWVAGDLVIGTSYAEVKFIDGAGKSDTYPDDKPMMLVVREKV